MGSSTISSASSSGGVQDRCISSTWGKLVLLLLLPWLSC